MKHSEVTAIIDFHIELWTPHILMENTGGDALHALV